MSICILRKISVLETKTQNCVESALQKAQGNFPLALRSYQQSLAIRKKLTARDRTNARWQQELAYSYAGIGDVQQAQEDFPLALRSYQQSLAIRAKLAERDPTNVQWQDDLSVIYKSIDDVQMAQGD